jgi:2-iminobutanoate/2-iminopropanoate deaminase
LDSLALAKRLCCPSANGKGRLLDGRCVMTRAGFVVSLSVAVAVSLAGPGRGQVPEKRFVTPGGQRPSGLFAPGVMVGKTLYIAGKGDYKPNEEFPAKVKNCLGEIEKTLKQAGLGFEHVVKSFVYLEDHDKYDEMNKYYGEFFPKNPPARTTLGVAQVPGESRLEITCIAYADLGQRKAIGEPPPNRPYSPAILAGDTLYVSGKGDQLADGSHPATFEEQVRQCMRNVEASLKQAGLDFRHVVMSNIFVDDPNNRAAAHRVYHESFEDGSEPAAATVVVDWIPGGSHVEVTCVATTDLAGRKVVRLMNTGARSAAGPRHSEAVWAGNTLYVSGLEGATDAGQIPAGLDEQVHQLGRNHTAVLKQAGLSLEDIVSGHVYLKSMDDYAGMNAIYKEYFSKGPGVRTTLMPSTKSSDSTARVMASFIGAKTQPAK